MSEITSKWQLQLAAVSGDSIDVLRSICLKYETQKSGQSLWFCTDFTVVALVPDLAVAVIATNSIFANSVVYAGHRLACVAIYGIQEEESDEAEVSLTSL